MRRASRRLIQLGLIGASGYLVWRVIDARRPGPDGELGPVDDPAGSNGTLRLVQELQADGNSVDLVELDLVEIDGVAAAVAVLDVDGIEVDVVEVDGTIELIEVDGVRVDLEGDREGGDLEGGDLPEPAWVAPTDDGHCPTGFAVKAKLASGIFHVPGAAMYERTKADRCYSSAEAAELDGLRAPKR